MRGLAATAGVALLLALPAVAENYEPFQGPPAAESPSSQPPQDGERGGFLGRLWKSVGPGGETHERFKGRFIDTLKPGPYLGEITDPPGSRGLVLIRTGALWVGNYLAPQPDVESYADRIVDRLLAPAPVTGIRVKTRLLSSQHYNAQALPDGAVVIHLGVLRNVESEDELAALLAHEVSHVLLKHYESDWFVRAQEHGVAAVDVGLAVKAAAAAKRGGAQPAGPDWNAIKIQLLAEAVLFASDVVLAASFTREQEDEADLLAIDLLAAAGYSPDALATVLKKIGEQEKRAAEASAERKRRNVAQMDAETQQRVEKQGIMGALGGMFEAGKKAVTAAKDEARETIGAQHRPADDRRRSVLDYIDREYGSLPPVELKSAPWQAVSGKPSVRRMIDGYAKLDDMEDARERGDWIAFDAANRKLLAELSQAHALPALLAAERARAGSDRNAERRYIERALRAPDAPMSAYAALARLHRTQGRLNDAGVVLDRAVRDLADPPELLPDRIAFSLAKNARREADGHLIRCKLSGIKPLFKHCEAAYKGELDVQAPATPVAAAGSPPAAAAMYGRVTSATLMARGGPGLDHPVIDQFKQGTTFRIVERDPAGWLKVETPDGKSVWVFESYVKPEPAIDPVGRAKATAVQEPVAPSRPGVESRPAPAAAADRLRTLESLRTQGLISDAEYRQKRQEILSGL